MAIPIYNQPTVKDERTTHIYNNLNVNQDMFNTGAAQLTATISNLSGELATSLKKKQNQLEQTKIVELTNAMDAYANQALYDKDNGYFYKTGSNAMGKSDAVMKDYDKYASNLLENSGLSSQYKQHAQAALLAKRNKVFQAVNKHDYDETNNWQNSVYTQKESNLLNQGILDRNDDKLLEQNLKQAHIAITLQGQVQNWDDATVDLKKKDFTSKYHVAVINGLLGDGSLRAKQYYEAHKDEINPEKHNQLLNAVNSNENKYQSNLLADTYIAESNTEDEALEKAYQIENIELSDATAARIRQKYSEKRRLENQNESDLIGQFYDTVLSKQQTGQMLTYDDIPEGISSKNKLSLMSYINQNGQPKTQDDKWLELYNMSVNNAQGFASLDLNQYRGYLSDGEYKSFVKRQEDIKTGKYYTQIKDDDKMISEALKAIGLDENSMMPWGADKRDIAFSEIRAMTREFEARKGRSITDGELLDLTQSLGYKNDEGVKLYKEVEKGMRERAGFIRDVMNDFVYYQQQHKGQMPPNDEKMKIIQYRINNKISEQNNIINETINDDIVNENSFYGKKITSPFGLRKAPTEKASTDHKGIDLAYKMNEPIGAFESGEVVYTGYHNLLGNYIGIKDKNGAIHQYGHTNKVLVKRGDKISKGDIIANAGSTGESTGPHLHYAVIKADKYVDPIKYNEQNNINKTQFSERVAIDANGNKALVKVDSNGKIVEVIKEL